MSRYVETIVHLSNILDHAYLSDDQVGQERTIVTVSGVITNYLSATLQLFWINHFQQIYGHLFHNVLSQFSNAHDGLL